MNIHTHPPHNFQNDKRLRNPPSPYQLTPTPYCPKKAKIPPACPFTFTTSNSKNLPTPRLSSPSTMTYVEPLFFVNVQDEPSKI